jgi:hypothetical protein
MADDPFADIGAKEDPFADIVATSPDVTPATPGQPARITVRPPRHPSEDQPPVTAGEAFGRGAARAGGYGFGDELAGVAAAGGANLRPATIEEAPSGLAVLGDIGKGAFNIGTERLSNLLFGQPETAQQKYEAEKEYQRARDEKGATEHPIATAAGGVTGAVISPLVFTPAKPGIFPATVAAARTGAVQGGLTGLGEAEGDLGERIPKAVEGAGLGAAIAGVATPALSGLGWTVRQMLAPAGALYRNLRGLGPQEGAARVAARTGADVAAGDVGLTTEQAAAAQARGQPVLPVDMFGAQTRDLARAAHDTDPTARAALQTALEERATSNARALRLSDWLKRQYNNPDPIELRGQIQAQGSLVNEPAYKAAYEAGDRPITNMYLERLVQADRVRGAMKAAIHDWKDEQIRSGYYGLNSPYTINEAGDLVFTGARGGLPTSPNAQLWDYTLRKLKGAAEAAKAPNGDATQESRLLNDLTKQVQTQVYKEVPELENAVATSRTSAGHVNAIDFGRDFFRSHARNDFRENLADFAKFTDRQKAIAQDGYIAALVDHVQNDRALKITPAFRNELETMLGTQKAAEIEDWLRVEALMKQSKKVVTEGSPTARLLRTAKEYALPTAGAYGAAALYNKDYDPTDPVTFTSTVLGLAGAAKYSRTNALAMRQVANLLTSGNPADFNRALQTITAKPALRRMLHDASDALMPGSKIGRISGTAAGEGVTP